MKGPSILSCGWAELGWVIEVQDSFRKEERKGVKRKESIRCLQHKMVLVSIGSSRQKVELGVLSLVCQERQN